MITIGTTVLLTLAFATLLVMLLGCTVQIRELRDRVDLLGREIEATQGALGEMPMCAIDGTSCSTVSKRIARLEWTLGPTLKPGEGREHWQGLPGQGPT